MDTVLLGVHRSDYEAALKTALTRTLVAKSAHLPVPEDECRRILAAGVAIIQSAPTDALAETGALVVREWGRHHAAVLEQAAVPAVLEPLLDGPVPLSAPAGTALLAWLMDRQPSLVATARRRLSRHAAHPGHTADTLAALAGLMIDRPACRPRFEDAVTLSQGLIRSMAPLRMPDQSGQISLFVSQMEQLGLLFQELFSSTQTVVRAMDTLYEVMTGSGGGSVCPALSVVLQAVPVKLVTPACSQLNSLKSGGAETTCAGIGVLCDWLLVWPRATRLAVWVAALVREAAGGGHTADLDRLVLARIDKLFQGLTLPAVRRSVFPVVSLLLLGFQRSPAAFFKVLPRVPDLLDQLRQEAAGRSDGADFCQVADLVQTLMRLHPSCVQRYSAIVRALQGRSPPPPSVMASLLVSSAWTEPSQGSEPTIGEAPVSAPTEPVGVPGQRRRGLINLGNTCYMNAVLQALFHSDQFRSEVLAARLSPSRPHLAALQRVFAFLAFSERPAYSPAEFQRVALPPWFERGRQHDCSEFLRYLLDAMHEEERTPAPPAAPVPVPAPVLPAPAAAHARDDSSVPGAGVADRPRPRRRHRSCDTAPAAGGPPLVPLSDLVSDDVVMAEPDSGGGGAERTAGNVPSETVDSSCPQRTEPDGQEGPAAGADGGTGDASSEEAAAGLVRRLLTGRAETTYTCLTCGGVSRHEDAVTDVHLALPEVLTRSATVAAAGAGGADTTAAFGPQPRPDGWRDPPPDCGKDGTAGEAAAAGEAGESAATGEGGTAVEAETAELAATGEEGIQADFEPMEAQEPPGQGDEPPQSASDRLEGQESDSDQAPGAGSDVRPLGANNATSSGSNVERRKEQAVMAGSSQSTPCDPEPALAEPAPVYRPLPKLGPEPAPLLGPEPAPVLGPEPAPVYGPKPAPVQEETPDSEPEVDLTVSDLLRDYLAPERLCGDNQYHCVRCAGLRDAERQLRLLAPPPHLVVSLVRFVFDRRTGARRKVLAPVGLTERLEVPLADRPPAQYRLYAVIVHAGHSLDAGHYFSFCRASGAGGCDGGGGLGDDDWWRLDDSSAVPVTAAAALGRPKRSTDAAYTLLYRLAESSPADDCPPPAMAALPGPLRAAVDRDNAVYRQERRGRPVGALPLVHNGRPPPGAGCGGDSGHPGPGFVC
ncbi:ubiquitin carboxyl-terminal hydrolase 35-like [Amphibalanus amphitrite]|uniref:ubiquitin carboxyl-terminal hydrolase 35-like n=1 Tax=Amphibalanus amphitrite TaxID=1232801 RepID=UPI001C9168F7|nr:ubiquitin carboxyl-terminal hydrolase 35-like [Amphibalanus amphitrite]